MTRIAITGGPKTGKTTLAEKLLERHDWPHDVPDCDGCGQLRHTDDLIHLGWSEASQAASLWFDEPGPWIIEGVAVSRALRKWKEQHPGERPPVDRVIFCMTPHVERLAGQISMALGVHTVHETDVQPWLEAHGIETEYR